MIARLGADAVVDRIAAPLGTVSKRLAMLKGESRQACRTTNRLFA